MSMKGEKKAGTVELRVKELGKMYRLCPELVQSIQMSAVQSVVLYKVEL